jgi:hypothetical protein
MTKRTYAFALIALLCAGCGTISPKPVISEQASYENGVQNSGLLAATTVQAQPVKDGATGQIVEKNVETTYRQDGVNDAKEKAQIKQSVQAGGSVSFFTISRHQRDRYNALLKTYSVELYDVQLPEDYGLTPDGDGAFRMTPEAMAKFSTMSKLKKQDGAK